ncbi:MAG: sulfatase [Conexibacter sp.]|nr:sulfatase [Conexibacter sp.]
MRAGRSKPIALLASVVVLIAIAGCGSASRAPEARRVAATTGTVPPNGGAVWDPQPAAQQPNVVFVLTDDLDTSLVRYMPHVQELARRGVSFSNYFVTDSLCCPARASIFTGRFPHNTGVFTNSGADGGWNVFHDRGNENATFATSLQSAGYRTALMGKYLNQYPARAAGPGLSPYVPPGWSEWDVAGNGYPEYGYNLARNDRVVHHGHRPSDYLTNVLAKRGLGFIAESVAAQQPFMLELATFAPHAPATPAPQDRNRFAGVTAPRDASFDEADMSDKPAWIRDHPPLTPDQLTRIDAGFRRRVRSVQAVDRLLARIEQRLVRLGIADRTYVVFSSDNGFHMGQHRLTPGKLTAYEPDIRVPLVVAGPGVPPGQQVDALAENIDLAPTFAKLAGAVPLPGADGRSLVPLMQGFEPFDWRTGVLVEHRGMPRSPDDPDFAPAGSGNPPTYEALRTASSLYVEYDDGEREYYDLVTDPEELHNIADQLTPEHALRLHQAVAAMKTCQGPACWPAQHTAG